MSAGEIAATRGAGVFTQRVFAQGFEVSKGQAAAQTITEHDLDCEAVLQLYKARHVVFPEKDMPKLRPKNEDNYAYDYWADHHLKPAPGSPDFWHPRSLPVKYSVTKGLKANQHFLAKIFTLVTEPFAEPFFMVALNVGRVTINALPPKEWKIPLQAPALPEVFTPQSVRLGHASEAFDEGYDAPADARDSKRQRTADDPYANAPGTPQGNEQSEATLRYQHHAEMRMEAKREHLVAKDAKVEAEDHPERASEQYTAWRSKKIKKALAATTKAHATDHSTIMTNPMHAEKVLAYDVAIGCCDIRAEDLQQLRIAADWRFLKGLDDQEDPHLVFAEYFKDGKFKGVSTYKWANAKDSEGLMPKKIVDERQWPKPTPAGEGG